MVNIEKDLANMMRKVIILSILFYVTSLHAQEFRNDTKYSISYSTVHSHSLLNIQYSGTDFSPYQLDKSREIILLGTGGVLGITGLALINNIQPLTFEEISQLDPSDINSFDRDAVGSYRDYLAGDLLLYGSLLLPLTFLSNQKMKRDWMILGVIGLEVLLLQAGVNAVVKGLTQRIRPYVYDPNTHLSKKTSKDAKLSFYSGHTSTTASMSFFTAKVFSDYLPDGASKTLIWMAAAIYPAVAGYLRVASAKHFATDVIVGYCMGAMFGYFIPELHRVNRKNNLSFLPSLTREHIALKIIYLF